MIHVIITMFVLGLFSAPHCLTMCGNLCHGLVGQSSTKQILFHLTRVASYVACAIVFSLLYQGLELVSSSLVIVRYLILAIQAVILFWGLTLIFNARLPRQLDAILSTTWRTIHRSLQSYKLYMLAAAWGVFPCGVLIVAYTQATMMGSVFHAALGMFVFGITSSLVLLIVPSVRHLFLQYRLGQKYQELGLRGAGCFLVITSTFAMYHLLAAEILAYCFV